MPRLVKIIFIGFIVLVFSFFVVMGVGAMALLVFSILTTATG